MNKEVALYSGALLCRSVLGLGRRRTQPPPVGDQIEPNTISAALITIITGLLNLARDSQGGGAMLGRY